jgi:glycosyltransferase involved in cell wall biosynthesis
LANFATAPMKAIHIFNRFHNPYGGSELEALHLFSALREKAEVYLWATSSRASEVVKKQFPVRRVGLTGWGFPNGGNYVFVGSHWGRGLWPYLVGKPDRVVYVYNTFHPKITALTSRARPLLSWPRTEYIFISDFQKKLLSLDGTVHPSPIDIQQFSPKPRRESSQLAIGRLSRDVPEKYHPDDLPLFTDLARQGCKIRLQGATCVRDKLRHPNIEVFPEGHTSAAEFLHGLDIFYYRTRSVVETFGRVVIEAMACGLPVVCHSFGGYADWIHNGENGFLFDTPDEARDILDQLRADPDLRRRVGHNARTTVEGMYSALAQEERLAFYLR